jgi:23S rRNA (adenine2503-C2)-methyltransferase
MAVDLRDLGDAELREWLAARGEPRFRALQIRRWLYQRGAVSFEEMTDLPRPLREALKAEFALQRPQIARRSVSVDGTRKLLLRLADGAEIETVAIPMARDGGPPRLTLCVSSQVGCGMGCAFCATATLGLRRNLRAREILDQVLEARRDLLGCEGALPPGRAPLHNLVFMGMGEPLHNLDEVIRAISILTAEWGPGFSPRRITVSTVGLVPQMARLLEETRVNLAISISATTDAARTRLVPVNRKYPLEVLLAACRSLPLPRRRRITFEYVLLEGQNDSLADARRLAGALRGIPSKVNLIPFNPFPGTPFRPTPRAGIEAFRQELARHGLQATVRESRGADIQAACGQLAAGGSGCAVMTSAKRPPEAVRLSWIGPPST